MTQYPVAQKPPPSASNKTKPPPMRERPSKQILKQSAGFGRLRCSSGAKVEVTLGFPRASRGLSTFGKPNSEVNQNNLLVSANPHALSGQKGASGRSPLGASASPPNPSALPWHPLHARRPPAVRPAVNIRFNPTTKIGSKMGGELTYPKMGSHWY